MRKDDATERDGEDDRPPLDEDKMPILKAVDEKVLLSLLEESSANATKVSSINGKYRERLKHGEQHSNIHPDAIPTFNKVFRKAQKNSFDAKVLIVRLEEGIEIIRKWMDRQASLELDKGEQREERKQTERKEANKKAAKENGESLGKGIQRLQKKADKLLKSDPPNPDKPDKQRAVGVIDQISGGVTH